MEYAQVPLWVVTLLTHLGAACGGMLLVAIPIGFAMWRMGKKDEV